MPIYKTLSRLLGWDCPMRSYFAAVFWRQYTQLGTAEGWGAQLHSWTTSWPHCLPAFPFSFIVTHELLALGLPSSPFWPSPGQPGGIAALTEDALRKPAVTVWEVICAGKLLHFHAWEPLSKFLCWVWHVFSVANFFICGMGIECPASRAGHPQYQSRVRGNNVLRGKELLWQMGWAESWHRAKC